MHLTGTSVISTENLTVAPQIDVVPTEQNGKIASKSTLLAKIWSVAKKAIKILVNIALYYLNPSMYAVGFIIGVIWDKKTEETLQKIQLIWKNQTQTAHVLLTLGAILSMHISLAAGSILCGAELGSSLSLSSQLMSSLRS
ncbi:MAG: hypothetical protein WCF65_04305 [Parachlamydiaceae bacterium]